MSYLFIRIREGHELADSKNVKIVTATDTFKLCKEHLDILECDYDDDLEGDDIHLFDALLSAFVLSSWCSTNISLVVKQCQSLVKMVDLIISSYRHFAHKTNDAQAKELSSFIGNLLTTKDYPSTNVIPGLVDGSPKAMRILNHLQSSKKLSSREKAEAKAKNEAEVRSYEIVGKTKDELKHDILDVFRCKIIYYN